MIRGHHLLLLAALIAVVGCSSGDDGGCDTDNGTALSMSAWPKFRHDLANTGRTSATIAATAHAEKWVFPARTAAPFANAATSPVVLIDDQGTTDINDDRIKIVVVAGQPEFATTNRVYLLHPATGADDGSFDVPLSSTASVSPGSTPVITLSRIGIMFTDGFMRQFDFKGTFINSLSASGNVIGSLTVDHKGTIYTAAGSGAYSSLCASGGARYLISVGSSESSPALYEGDPSTTDDDVSVIASNDGKVRALNFDGDLLWTFTATSAVRASVVYDADNNLVYGVDASGLVFAIDAVDGRRCRNLSFKIGGPLDVPVVASPAFADNVLYVIDTTGVLHALAREATCDTASSAPSSSLVERWFYPSGASVSSSPALASSPDGQPVVVFGSDDGTVHAVAPPRGEGTTGTALWTHCTQERGAFGRSSAAVGADGTVYVTTAAGRLYALSAGEDASIPCSMLQNATPTASPSASASPSPTVTALP